VPTRILIVEDVRPTREVVAKHLRKGGYEVEEASDGQNGLARALANPPDLVITDLEMPRLGGLGLLRALKEQQPECPAIVLSAHEDQEHMLGAIRQGIVYDYLIKPVDPVRLDIAISRALEVRALRAKAREFEQVKAMRQLAMTAGDQILNPLNVITLVIHLLETNPNPENIGLAIEKLNKMSDRISIAVTRMSQILRYAPERIAGNLWQINLDEATMPVGGRPGGDEGGGAGPADAAREDSHAHVAAEGTAGLSEVSCPGVPDPMIEALLSWVEGDRELLLELLQMSVEETPVMMERLRAAIAANQGEAVMQVAHSLKGSIANFGPVSVDLKEVVLALEQAGRSGNLEEARPLFLRLETGMSDLCRQFRQLIEFLAHPSAAVDGCGPDEAVNC
jgi:CheY-like chemotaxis protein